MPIRPLSLKNRRHMEEYREDFIKSYRRNQGGMSPKSQVEQEKRVRREIANSNERRRMQSINHGFEQIRQMLPPPQEGEKYSKATILQLAVKYIQNLETDTARLSNQLKMISPSSNPLASCIGNTQGSSLQPVGSSNTPPRKRKLDETNTSVDLDLKRRATIPNMPGMKSYDDITSENVNLRQYLGKLVTDKDDLQRQIDFLRQQIADIANPAAAAMRQQGYPISTVASPLPQTGGLTSSGVSAAPIPSGNPAASLPSVQGRLATPAQAVTAVVPSATVAPSGTLHVGVSGQSPAVAAPVKGATFHVQKVVSGQAQPVQLATASDLTKAQLGHVHPQVLPQPLPQTPQQLQQQASKQLEIIHVPMAASAAANVKPNIDHFIVDSAASVTIPRSAESTSPQPLTLTSVQTASDISGGFGGSGTIQKKSLDALVLAIQQIEGTSMGGSPEELKDQLGCSGCSSTNDAINNNNNNNTTINNNNNNIEDIHSSGLNEDNTKLKSNKNLSINNNNNEEDVISTFVHDDVTESEHPEPGTEIKREPGSESEVPGNGGASDEYPIVTKLLNRPIPHKYLHRPQVVVNSSH